MPPHPNALLAFRYLICLELDHSLFHKVLWLVGLKLDELVVGGDWLADVAAMVEELGFGAEEGGGLEELSGHLGELREGLRVLFYVAQ